ncbi:uncharacterized protein LOC111017452 [Momordica charantia]|uniref:Uncharacterized protein LOC111017452 n=1 Tax=Momordica charantia TaxID=3673 RepID=A0A6J1D6Q8_MOMCH|nr:uncharacterized protein LOC111017452 [Momordica charantia]XP_022148891.1 uncharacterized protein LOC111017452 [Momordica charantia]XP_022148892.1 uncharacterized protein LOC111017452 [Momordica charantia]
MELQRGSSGNSGNLTRLQEILFPELFKKKVSSQVCSTSNEVVNELYALACGPDRRVNSYQRCVTNGVRFNTNERDDRYTTQNSGVCVFGGDDNERSDFYGIIKEVIELKYIKDKRVLLFRCDWYDTNPKKNHVRQNNNFTSINTCHLWYKDDPFILVSQAQQVFYVGDLQLGNGWKVAQKIQHRHLWDVPEVEEIDLVEVDINQCVVDEVNLETQTFHRSDIDPSIVSDNTSTIEIVLNFDEVQDEIEDEDEDEDEYDETTSSDEIDDSDIDE